MNLLTSNEIIILQTLVNRRIDEGTSEDYGNELQEISRKLESQMDPQPFKPNYPYHIAIDRCLTCGGKLESPSEGRIGCRKCDYSTQILKEVLPGRPPYPSDENGSFRT